MHILTVIILIIIIIIIRIIKFEGKNIINMIITSYLLQSRHQESVKPSEDISSEVQGKIFPIMISDLES